MFVRTFADLPPLLKLLAELRRRRKEQQVPDDKLDAYLQAILVAMSRAPEQAESTKELMRQEGLEPLTERELQILHLLERSHKQGDCERTGGHTRNSQAAYPACVSQAQRE